MPRRFDANDFAQQVLDGLILEVPPDSHFRIRFRNGKEAIVIEAEEFDSLEATAEILSVPSRAAAIKRGLEQERPEAAFTGSPAEAAFDRIDAALKDLRRAFHEMEADLRAFRDETRAGFDRLEKALGG